MSAPRCIFLKDDVDIPLPLEAVYEFVLTQVFEGEKLAGWRMREGELDDHGVIRVVQAAVRRGQIFLARRQGEGGHEVEERGNA